MTSAATPRVDRAPFGTMPDGMAVERVTLRGADDFEASVITYGAALQSLVTRDRAGLSEDVVFGHDDLESYLAARRFFGATVGRYAAHNQTCFVHALAVGVVELEAVAVALVDHLLAVGTDQFIERGTSRGRVVHIG